MKNFKQPNTRGKNTFAAWKLLFLITGVLFQSHSFGQTTQTFTNSGTFTVPAGVTTVQVEAWGGGGGGGGVNGSGSQTRAGGGGAGGAYAKNTSFAVTPGANITVHVGDGGDGNDEDDGDNGEASTFGSFTANGGQGGHAGESGSQYGSGGAVTAGTFNGGSGSAASSASSGSSGAGGGGAGSTASGGNASGTTAGTGGAGGGGAGGAGRTTSGDGNDAAGLSGGGGGGRSSSSSDRSGGDGFRGQVKVTYTCVSYSLTASSGATPVCVSAGTSLISVSGSAAGLPAGSYTVTYNRSSPSATGLTASMTVSAAGSGSFTATGLTTAGNSTITITNLVSASCNSSISINNTAVIVVNAAPSANASNNGPICSGNSLNLSSNSAGVTYQWSGPASFSSTLQNPSRPNALTTYGGTYTLTVTSTTTGCTASTTTAATVNATPAASASTNGAACVGSTLNLTGGPGSQASYSWAGPNGYTSSSQNPSRSNAQLSYSGIYTITVTSSAGCSATASTNVTVNPIPAASASNNGPVCQGSNLNLSASGGTSYSWSGPDSYNSSSQNPSVSNVDGSNVGTYTVTVTANGCSSTATTVLSSIKPHPLPAPGASAPSVCAGSAVTLTSKQDVTVGNSSSFNIPNNNSTGITSQIIISGFSPSVLASATIKSVNFNISHNNDGDLEISLISPSGSSILLVNNRGGSGNNFTNTTIVNSGGANGNVSSGSAPFTGTYNTENSFTGLNGANGNGTWGLKVVDNVSSNSGSLSNWTLTLVSNGVTYSWSSNPSGFSSALQNPVANPLQNTTYTVIADESGCTNSGSALVNTLSVPQPDASTNAPLCSGSGLMLFGNNYASGQSTGNTYAWTGPNGFNSSLQNPGIGSASSLHAGIYTLTVTNSISCTASTTTQVIVNPNPALSIATQTDVSCNGFSDGSVDVDANGGTPFYLFDLNGNSTLDGIYSGLTAGSYIVTVTDDNGCEAASVLNVNISEPAVLDFSLTSANTSCPASMDGNIIVNATGGTQNYFYSYDNGLNYQSSNTFSDLPPGNYNVVVRDAHNCITAPAPVTITASPDITAPVISNIPSDFTSCNPITWSLPTAIDNCGSVTLTSNYNPGVILPVGVNAISYIAEDNYGNTSTVNFNVTVVPPPTADIISSNSSICLSSSTTVNLSFTGSSPWNYIITDGSQTVSGTSSSASASIYVTPATSGIHTYTISSVTDATCNTAGSITGSAIVTVSSAPPSNNIGSVNGPQGACDGDIVHVTTNAVGGQNIRYSWNTGTNSSVVLFSTSASGPFSAGPFETSTNSVYAQFGGLLGSSGYNVCVQGVNGCGSTNNKCDWIRGVVGTPGTITGTPVVCSGDTKNYSAGISGGATSYNWTFSVPGAVINNNGTQNVSVTFPAFTSGQLCVTASLACGGSSISAARCMTISNNPAVPGVMTGPNKICPGSTNISYSVPAVAGATGYNWTVPPGASIVETAPYTNSIHVDFPSPYNNSPPVCVTAISDCGASIARCRNVSSMIPPTPGSITGPTSGVCNSTVQYSIANVSGATNYNWIIPNGAINLVGQGSTSIQFDMPAPFTNGFVRVSANNSACNANSSLRNLFISGVPTAPAAIISLGEICDYQPGSVYVNPVFSATGYTWALTNGTIDYGQGTNNIDLTWGSGSGTIKVRAGNSCGLSALRTLDITPVCRMADKASDFSEEKAGIYPNPAHDKITLTFKAEVQENVLIEVADLSGRKIQAANYNAEKGMNELMIDLNDFSKGAYFIRVKSDNLNKQLPFIIQ